MADFKPLYRWSAAEAKQIGEMDRWRNSFKESQRCRDFMDERIRQGWNGSDLNSNVAGNIVEAFGFDRSMWLLANHIQLEDWDRRFSASNQAWAQSIYIQRPAEWELKKDTYISDRNRDLRLKSHPVKIDDLTGKVRQMHDGLNLYDHRHCEAGDIHAKDFKDRLLILRADALKESARTPENQLFHADIGGFCCHPNARGRSVMGHFLADGERATFHRNEFCGVADPEQLPEWAAVKLHELQNPAESPAQTESADMTMKGM
jgi:hypothetical protein